MLLAALPAWAPSWAAEPTLKITAPADGAVVDPAKEFTVEVEAEPAVAFQTVAVIGENPIGLSDVLTAPPYRFTMKTKPDCDSGVYRLTAIGRTRSGEQVYSKRVSIDLERSDDPTKLKAELSSVSFGEVGEECLLVITGVYGDGSLVSVSRSTRTKYSSSDPSVVVVEGDMAKAVGPGFADITVKHGPLNLVIPVGVPPEKQQ